MPPATHTDMLFAESLALLEDMGDLRGIAEYLTGLAGAAVVTDQAARGARLCGVADSILDESGAAMSPSNLGDHARIVSALRAALSGAGFQQAWGAGRAMPLGGAIADARRLAAEIVSVTEAIHDPL